MKPVMNVSLAEFIYLLIKHIACSFVGFIVCVFGFFVQLTAGGRLKRSSQPTAWDGGELMACIVKR